MVAQLEPLLTSEEFAAAARVPVSTIRYWRHIKRGPQGFRVGRRVLYRERDVAAWLADLQVRASRGA